MTETLCQECYDPLPDGAAVCQRCGTARPRGRPRRRRTTPTPTANRPTAARSGAPRRIAVALGLGLAGAAALFAGVGLFGADPQLEVEVTEAPVAEAAPGGGSLHLTPNSAVPGDVSCLVDDHDVSGGDCVEWLLAAPEGQAFSRVASGGDVVVTAVGASLAAVDAATGEVRWRSAHRRVGELGDAPNALLIAGDRVVALYEAEHRIVAFDLASGAEAWTFRLEEQRQAWLATAGDEGRGRVVAVREPTTLTVLTASGGEPVMRTGVRPAGPPRPLVVEGRRVLAGSAGGLVAWDYGSGSRLWATEEPIDSGVTPVVAGDQVVAVNERGGLLVLGLDDGRARSRMPAPPGMSWLVDLGGERVAAVRGRAAHIIDITGRDSPARLGIGGIQRAWPAADGQFFAEVGQTLRRISPALAGETWTLRAVRPHEVGTSVLATPGDGQARLITPLDGGRLLAAFPVPPGDETGAASGDCDGSRPSEALGTLPAWQGGAAHVAVRETGAITRVWVGTYEPPDIGFTVSARRRGGGEHAEFRHFGGDWRRTLVIGDGRRTADRFASHWSFAGRFPAPGCWAFDVSWGGQVHRVVVPVADGDLADE